MQVLHFKLNGKETEVTIEDNMRLLDLLRSELHLTGTKEGCGVGECGACTVIVDGNAVDSCLCLAASVDGRSVTTIEGLENNGILHPLQEAVLRHNALQCGFCIPGFIMSAKALLDKNPHPSRDQIKEAISGNLCRCTGYEQLIEAIEDAANMLIEQTEGK